METIKHLEQENHALRDLSLSSSSGTAASGASEADTEAGRKDRDRHTAKELRLLKRTIEEMELRIETQKQTLATRDESIRKLMDMLQAKGYLDFFKSLLPLVFTSLVVCKPCYASAGVAAVGMYVCLSVCHTLVLYQNEHMISSLAKSQKSLVLADIRFIPKFLSSVRALKIYFA